MLFFFSFQKKKRKKAHEQKRRGIECEKEKKERKRQREREVFASQRQKFEIPLASFCFWEIKVFKLVSRGRCLLKSILCHGLFVWDISFFGFICAIIKVFFCYLFLSHFS